MQTLSILLKNTYEPMIAPNKIDQDFPFLFPTRALLNRARQGFSSQMPRAPRRPSKRDKSPKRYAKPVTLEVLKVVMDSGWIQFRELQKLYQTSNKVQALFVDFGVSFRNLQPLHVPTRKIWQDMYKAQSFYSNFLPRCSIPNNSELEMLIVLLMYVDLHETAMYIVRSLNVGWRYCLMAVSINGRLCAHNAIKAQVPPDELEDFDELMKQHKSNVFYVSSEIYAHFHAHLNGPSQIQELCNLLIRSIHSKSIVAFEYCRFKLRENEYLASYSWARAMKYRYVTFQSGIVERAKDWTYPSAVIIAKWLTTASDCRSYVEVCDSCKSEAELRASFSQEHGRWQET